MPLHCIAVFQLPTTNKPRQVSLSTCSHAAYVLLTYLPYAHLLSSVYECSVALSVCSGIQKYNEKTQSITQFFGMDGGDDSIRDAPFPHFLSPLLLALPDLHTNDGKMAMPMAHLADGAL